MIFRLNQYLFWFHPIRLDKDGIFPFRRADPAISALLRRVRGTDSPGFAPRIYGRLDS